MKKAAVGAPNGTLGVQSFGSAQTRRMRLPLRDEADLRYALADMVSEAGLRSASVAVQEETIRSRPCDVCATPFLVKKADDDNSQRRCESPRCQAHNAHLMSVTTEEKVPPPRTEGLTTITVNGVPMLAYEGVSVRRFPTLPPREGPQAVHPSPTSSRGDARGLNQAEEWSEFSGAVRRRHTNGRRCLESLALMVREGKTREVEALRRVYGAKVPNARVHVWGIELAPLADLTEAVALVRKEIVERGILTRTSRLDAETTRMRGAQADRMTEMDRTEADARSALEDAEATLRETELRSDERGVRATRNTAKKVVAAQTRALDAIAAWRRNTPSPRSTRAPKEKAEQSIRVTTMLEVTAQDAIAEMLDTVAKKARGESEGKRLAAQRVIAERRKLFIATVAKQAEQLLVSAASAYRQARRSVADAHRGDE